MRHWIPAICLVFITLLSGCETSKKLYQVITDPDVPVGYPSEKPSVVTLSLLADSDVNPNYSGEPTPIDIQLVFMNEDSKLLGTYYDQVASGSLEQVLGKNYLDHQDYTLEPGQFKTLKTAEINANTQFIGVIAHYSYADEVAWLDVIPLEGVGQKFKLLIHVRADEVEIKEEK